MSKNSNRDVFDPLLQAFAFCCNGLLFIFYQHRHSDPFNVLYLRGFFFIECLSLYWSYSVYPAIPNPILNNPCLSQARCLNIMKTLWIGTHRDIISVLFVIMQQRGNQSRQTTQNQDIWLWESPPDRQWSQFAICLLRFVHKLGRVYSGIYFKACCIRLEWRIFV